ncbi:hypothetical protein Sinac_3597 [Singulisphaera acidiphila DSM 18658]|uniref:Uncharacterized protein n=1 Tax=Singulisphaera acidiphila (strain ATCC BAA-1392 / DSM 18658 / VKM B-2454 / MOB10) TaxID=886293 RepID=L0DF02_SINAD|nr:hypothetical protein Sinac_3597 [Singulisphaera acidiphila DSM 18658]
MKLRALFVKKGMESVALGMAFGRPCARKNPVAWLGPTRRGRSQEISDLTKHARDVPKAGPCHGGEERRLAADEAMHSDRHQDGADQACCQHDCAEAPEGLHLPPHEQS